MLKEYSLSSRHRGAPEQNKKTFRNDCMARFVLATDRHMEPEGFLSTPHPVATAANMILLTL
ncbi:hypothetical protein SAMN05518872_111105 [Psychrobacillus sp. OK032]|nr:hypothetical protein SAMN05518872_111105 [Psychrobacillus sp. OK032]